MVKAIIAEDEPLLAAELHELLTRLWPDLKVYGVAKDGIEALAMFERHWPDVMFLDIQMPGLTGLEVARETAGRCHVVFATAYDSHAVAAFEQGAIDYVLKPYDRDRLEVAVRRVQQRMAIPPPSLDRLIEEIARIAAPRSYLRWIKASKGRETQLILVDDVCYFRADAKYTSVFTAGGEALIRMSIKQLAEKLDPEGFWTIHRSTIVNLKAVRGVTRAFDGGTWLTLKHRPERLAVSEAHRSRFKNM